jgi:hypothetical protein
MQKQCYVVLSIITKSVEIPWALTLAFYASYAMHLTWYIPSQTFIRLVHMNKVGYCRQMLAKESFGNNFFFTM